MASPGTRRFLTSCFAAGIPELSAGSWCREAGEADSFSSLVNPETSVSWHSILLPVCRTGFQSPARTAACRTELLNQLFPLLQHLMRTQWTMTRAVHLEVFDAGEHSKEGYLLARVCSRGGQMLLLMKKLSRITSSRLIAFLRRKMSLVSNWLFQ